MKIDIKFGNKMLSVQVPDDATLGDLRTAITEATSVPASLQKLMGKPNLKDDTKALSELGIKDGTKLMLIGSTATEVLAANTESQAKEEQRVKRIKNLGGNIWLLPAFAGFMADPYVGGKGRPLEGGSAAEALTMLDVVMSRINPVEGNASILQAVGGAAAGLSPATLAQISHPLLPNLTMSHRRALSKAHMVLRKATELTTMLASIDEAAGVPEAIAQVVAAVRSCGDGEYVLIPSGWIGQQEHTIVFLILTRTSGTQFSVILVNRVASNYHPHMPTADKIKTQPCIRFDRIPEEKVMDEAFWLVALSLWMRANDPENKSEYCRGEVLYDCLMPWLSEGSVATATSSSSSSAAAAAAAATPNGYFPDLTASIHTDPVASIPDLSLCEEAQQRLALVARDAKFATTARSESSAMKSLMTTLTFLVRSYVAKSDPTESPALVTTTLKQLKMALKYEIYLRAAEDLVTIAQRHIQFQAELHHHQKQQQRPSKSVVGQQVEAAKPRVSGPTLAKPRAGVTTASLEPIAPPPAHLKDVQRAVDRVLAAGADPRQSAVTLSLLFGALNTRDAFIKTPTNHIITDVETYFQGKFVFVYFSASWCGPCKKIAPLLRECHDRLVARLPRVATLAPGSSAQRGGNSSGADAAAPGIECVLASCDKSLAEFDAYASAFPNCLRLTWPNQAAYEAFDISSIPTLLVFSPSGQLMTAKGAQALLRDPEGAEFPEGDMWSGLTTLNETDLAMWEHASQTLAHAALKRYTTTTTNNDGGSIAPCTAKAWQLSDGLFEKVHTLLDASMDLVAVLPSHLAKGNAAMTNGITKCDVDGADTQDALTTALTYQVGQLTTPTAAAAVAESEPQNVETDEYVTSHPNGSLLPSTSKARYYGQAFKPVIPELSDTSAFTRPASMTSLLETLIDAKTFVDALWSRAKSSSTSSRVAVQMHVIEFISWLFTHVIAVPSMPRVDGTASSATTLEVSEFASGVFHEPFPDTLKNLRNAASLSQAQQNGDPQLLALKIVYHLQLSYCTAWQAVETPTRSYDSERCLVAVSMLLAYDALARNTQNAKECFLMAFLLGDDGGFYLSTTLCKSNRPYEDISARLELTKPHLTCVRDAQIAYIRFQHRTLRRELFDLRQTDKLELRKHSYTVDFMRRFLENCGYEIFPRANDPNAAMMMNMNQSEMEKLMMWFCDPRAPVAREHPEFTMLRDMTLLTKFLGTMELRDSQLLRKKKELDEFATWRLSFEEDTPGKQMSAGWRTRPDPPRWECLMVRGRDMDIADIVVKGFGDRELSYGEGLVLQSPIDVSAQINVDDATEDDILHAANLPTFGGTLTIEESEMLLSMLTTPYLRIPMVLNFFASSDRHSYLLHEDLQKVLRATLFEPGVHHDAAGRAGHIVPTSSPFASSSAAAAAAESPLPTEVPLRLTRHQKSEVQIAVIRGDVSKKDHTALLGTACGLLANELAHSPMSVFRPMLHLVRTVAALGHCSVYSVNASFTLYLLNLCADVLSYGLFSLQQHHNKQSPPSSSLLPPPPASFPPLREPAEVERAMVELQNTLDDVIGNALVPQWFVEAEDNDDTPTLCVLESYMAAFSKVKLAYLTWSRKSVTSGAVSASSEATTLVESNIHDSLVSLLASCTYVRARHGFGMGMQRTQLAAQSNQALLSPEEKLLRFLQAQGLDTSRVTNDMLEHGRRLMHSGGKRRAVFVQIRSRYYSDTVRVPNLFRVDAGATGGTADAKKMKLPPLDVPEHLIFSILLEEHKHLTTLLRCALQADAPMIGVEGRRRRQLDRIMNTVVQRVLREKKNDAAPALDQIDTAANVRDDAWDVSIQGKTATTAPAAASAIDANAPPPPSGGLVFSAPSSGLTFHLQTCELFWRNDELKPVPDSMSHYTDYETILGKDVMQCGLVRRSLHRHWIHIVGTPYDVMEWDTTDPEDQGVHQPRVLMGPPTTELVEQVKFDGVLFDRTVDIDDDTPWGVREERWAVDMVKRVLKEAFPMPQEMKYKPLALSLEDAAAAAKASSEFRLIMNDKPQYDKEEDRNTWKEIVITKDPRQLQVFNLVPHARGTYRSLVFCTDQRLALHSLALLRRPRDASSLSHLHYQAGELKRRVQNEGSLEIWRFNAHIRGREVFTPARLLQGVIPSALLESFLFWHGEDDILRGYPMSDDDDNNNGGSSDSAAAGSRQATLQHWFRYAVEVRFTSPTVRTSTSATISGNRIVITRRNDMTYTSAAVSLDDDASASASAQQQQQNTMKRQQSEVAVDAATGMRRSVSFDERPSMGTPSASTGGGLDSSRLVAPQVVDEASVAVLRSVYPSLPHRVLTYALRSAQLNISEAIEWVAAAENESTITGLIQQGAPSPNVRRGSSGGEVSPLNASQRSRSRTLDFDNPTTPAPGPTRAAAVDGDDAGELEDVSPIRERSMTSVPLLHDPPSHKRKVDNEEDEDQPQKAQQQHPQPNNIDGHLDVWRLLHLGEVSGAHPLRPLLDALTKVEDASHILIWGREDASPSSDGAHTTFHIHLVELPRLRAKFQPKLISEGTHTTTRLLLLDHPGWMLATSSDILQQQDNTSVDGTPSSSSTVVVDRRRSLQALAAPFPQHMILRNVSEEFALFVPNHDFAKLIVQGNPYATELLFDRSSLQWQESVPSPFYLYTVHSSSAFVVAPSLGASLYMAALCCMHRSYEVALRTLESCYVDTDFTVEEAYMCGLMQRSLDRNAPDLHPDAHAVRVKLAHAVMYSENKLAWPLHVELESYLEKVRHVSANCRLQREELLDLMKRCGRAPPLLKSQLQLWVPFLQQHPQYHVDHKDVRVSTEPHLLRMGQPWDKLLSMSFESISRSTITRIHYKPPAKPLVGEQLVKLLWEDEMLADEESGANRQLGFFFLYQLKRGRIPATLSGNANSGVVEGKSVAISLAQILTRYFHLRHSRWGKEAQESGESEAVPSFAMCVLGVMDAFPGASWPEMADRVTLDAMSRGTSTTNGPATDDASNGADDFSFGGGGGGRERRERRTKLPEMIRGLERLLRTLYSTSVVRLQGIRRDLQRAHQRYQDATTSVLMWHHIVARVLPTNTASSTVAVRLMDVFQPKGTTTTTAGSTSALEYMSTMPLNAVGIVSPISSTHGDDPDAQQQQQGDHNVATPPALAQYFVTASKKKCGPTTATNTSSSPLPFDVSTHPWAASHISKDMMERLGQDAQRYADIQRDTIAFALVSFQEGEDVGLLMRALTTTLPSTTSLGGGDGSLCEKVVVMKSTVTRLVNTLMQLNRVDESAIQHHREAMLNIANRTERAAVAPEATTLTPVRATPSALRYRLERIRRDRQDVAVEWLCGALLSTELQHELTTINPYHGDIDALRSHTAWLMLCSNRRAFGTNALAAARALLVFTSQVLSPLFAFIDNGANNSTHMVASDDSSSSSSAWCDEAAVLANLRRHGVDWSIPSTTASRVERARVISEAIHSRVSTLVRALVDILTAQRYHAHAQEEEGRSSATTSASSALVVTMEPRFLLFEFLFSFLLRKRQVEMVRWFVANVRDHGISRVQQMLMGQGKTTVVGPLLALILADGEQLVTQVMPTALLEQSRTVLRRCFSTIVPKRILSLQFDRSTEDNADVAEALFQKLDSARRMRAVVVSAPECVKALFLKYIEELHVIETIGNNDLDATTTASSSIADNEEAEQLSPSVVDSRRGREVKLLRDKTIARSNMADALVPILNLWRTGVMMMDEVDVLLHPLRSELNFPIGLKYPIDMSGTRWSLPMHLLSAVFANTFPTSTADTSDDNSAASTTSHHQQDGKQILYGVTHLSATFTAKEQDFVQRALRTTHQELQAVLQRGLSTKALQREPHMVLLDMEFYRSEMIPLLVQWISLWLHGSIESDRRYRKKMTNSNNKSSSKGSNNATSTTPPAGDDNITIEGAFSTFVASIHTFLTTTASHRLTDLKGTLESLFAPKEMQLLFLARDWLSTLLPHVLSKIDRVGFGMLQQTNNSIAVMDNSGGSSTSPSSLPPLSRRLMAIPFVAKDVPSRSSEFAHPDVVLGLTILAYRYEGLRLTDTKELLRQLKHDYSRQVGASEQRPASRLYASWLKAAAQATATCSSGGAGTSVVQIPLSQLQIQDPAHLHALHHAFKQLPTVLYYYLSHHVFPRTMNFQQLKISACGHELGSSLLFQKRIGFSGTPSNLLPLDLGECCYEPGSDGHMLSVLTNPSVTTCELLPDDWSPLSLLRRIATANPPFHSLIDTGALITNMDNEQVARYLLEYLPASQFEGVVFLDGSDRQVVLLRSSELVVPIAQCGVPLSRRFTFFDQVHTTGMDIKQMPTATAVVTLGKDLVFRDYAQGSYRMRGIGKGQKLRVYVIPEVKARLRDVLGPSRQTGRLEVDVPAWLILNAMRLEGLQFVKLCQQELLNIWRKRALQVLLTPPNNSTVMATSSSLTAGTSSSPAAAMLAAYERWVKNTTDFVRCRRFTALGATTSANAASSPDSTGGDVAERVRLMRGAIREFREVIAFPVPDSITVPISFQERIEEHLKSKLEALLDVPVFEPETTPPSLVPGVATSAAESSECLSGRGDATRRVTLVLSRMTTSSSRHAAGHHSDDANDDDEDPDTAVGLNAEVVHEQEAEEEQEQEAEQEEQRVSHFSRDDEQHIPWKILSVLADPLTVDAQCTRLTPAANSPFFQCNGLQLRPESPMLDVDPRYYISDNFFRARWRGSGERRLKNCMLFAHWLVVGGCSSSDGSTASSPTTTTTTTPSRRFISGLVTLAEGESLRWFLHHSKDLNATVAVSLCMVNQPVVSGGAAPTPSVPSAPSSWMDYVPFLDSSDLMRAVMVPSTSNDHVDAAVVSNASSSAASAVVFFRYLNNDMFYSPVELRLLRAALSTTPADVRLGLFLDMLRGRRRPNNEWQDTPIAEVFVENDAQHAALLARSVLKRLEAYARRLPQSKREAIASSWREAALRAGDITMLTSVWDGTVSVDGAIVALHSALTAASSNGAAYGQPQQGNRHENVTAVLSPSGLEEFTAAIRHALAANKPKPNHSTTAVAEVDDEELPQDAPVSLLEWSASVLPPLLTPPAATHQLWRCPSCNVRSVVLRQGGGRDNVVLTSPSCPHCSVNTADDAAIVVAVDDNEAEEVEDHWQCGVCTLINAPHCPACVVCGTASPIPPKKTTSRSNAATPPVVPTQWSCSVCTLLNEPSAPLCGACGTPNPQPPTLSSSAPHGGDVSGGAGSWDCPEGHWTCSVEQGGCSKYNPNAVFYCQVCDRARPNLASLRF